MALDVFAIPRQNFWREMAEFNRSCPGYCNNALTGRQIRYRPAQNLCATIVARFAGVVKLVDTQDLGSCAARRGGSSPSTRTNGMRFSSAIGEFRE